MSQAPMTADLLVEIGTEELPPKALQTLAQAFADGLLAGLVNAGLAHGSAQVFAAPRRLALRIDGLALGQPDRQVERRGPAVQAAFTADGQPSKAAEGFARSCGTTVDQLGRLKTDKGEWLAYTVTETGVRTADLLAELCAESVRRLPIPKRMRWGAGDAEFVRPVHWLVGLLGSDVIPGELFGLPFGRETYGHRFHDPAAIPLSAPADYLPELFTAHVMADFAERRASIAQQVQAKMAELGGQTTLDDELLDEVTALVEWPVALVGEIPAHYLELPPEVLVTTIQEHQRYFPVVAADGQLKPHFVTVSNIDSRDPARVKTGNERVVKPRLDDALFFWRQDRKQPLAARRDGLKNVVYQAELGSLFDRSERVATLAAGIGAVLDYPATEVARAGELAKCDLLTDLVYEFTELQGLMGRYYATADGESPAVAQALEDQYRPRFAGDELPASNPGRALALADKLDAIAGSFALGKKPTGDRDPFGLRRAALGVLRILIEQQLPLELGWLCEQAAAPYQALNRLEEPLAPALQAFIQERLRAYLADQGIAPDLFEAVAAVAPASPLDFVARTRALDEFAGSPAAASLAAAHKRSGNLLRKAAAAEVGEDVDSARLSEAAEQALNAALEQVAEPARAAAAAGDYREALTRLATVREPVDAFFDGVMVMSPDLTVRANRLALLKKLQEAFNAVADIGKLQQQA